MNIVLSLHLILHDRYRIDESKSPRYGVDYVAYL